MKAKNLFFGALTCLAFAACSNEDEPIVNGGAQAEGSNTYVAVKLVMSGNSSETRAWNEDTDNDENYPQGSQAELKVTDATFFFFDENGKSVQEAYTKNVSDTPTEGSTNSIDQEYTAYIVVKNVVPARIAAVLNLPEGALSDLKNLGEEDLYKKLSGVNYNWQGAESGKFVMSSTTFVNGTSVQTATPVTPKNIIKSDEEPEVGSAAPTDAVPVVLPVERLFARVSVTYTKSTETGKTTDLTNGQSTEVDLDNNPTTAAVEIKPFITGWWLHSTNKDSYLFKKLSASYTWDVEPAEGSSAPKKGWWNHSSWSRSYWADALNQDVTETSNFNSYKYSSNNLNDKYCFENTNANNATTLMLAAILKKFNTESEKWEAVNLIQWMGQNFTDSTEFKTYVAEFLDDKGYKNNGTTKLEAKNFNLVYNTNETASNEKNTYDWQTKLTFVDNVTLTEGSGNTSVTDANKVLADEVGFFKFYNKGQTYYFTKIQHEPNIDETAYAVIRNHKYVININGITGLGTPVPNPSDAPKDPEKPTPDTPTDPTPEYPDPDKPTPDPDQPTPDPDKPIDPETPTDDYSSISAKIQVLEYRIVKQDVNIGNQGGAGSN